MNTGGEAHLARFADRLRGQRVAIVYSHRFGAPLDDNPRRLTRSQLDELSEIVETGPDRAVDGVVRWRRIDLQRVISERFGIDYHERSIGKLLKHLGFSHIGARPKHPKQDGAVVEAFKKTSHARLQPISQA